VSFTPATATPARGYRVIAKPDNAAFCQRFAKKVAPAFEQILRGGSTGLFAATIDREALPAALPDTATQRLTSVEGHLRAAGQGAKITPGARKRLFIWTSFTHYFDGDVVAFGDNESYLEVGKVDVRFETIGGVEKAVTTSPLPPGWALLSGGRAGIYPGVSPRYVHFMPGLFEGMIVLLASPANRKPKPDAALISPDDKGGFATLCAFVR
jgi:hypothetical protein